MRLRLSPDCAPRLLETPSVYNIKKDELYELDPEAFTFIMRCASENGAETDGNEFTEYCLREGILTEDGIRRANIEQSPVPSLRYLELQITRSCNLNCGHCFVVQSDTRLSPKRLAAILKEFEDMQGLRVLITGGEPLMHPEFDEINALLPDYALRKVLITNGTLLDMKRLRSLNVDEIQISIDGLCAAHESLRGPHSFEPAMNALRMALECGIDASVATMVHAGDLGDFDEMDGIFRAMGLKRWLVDIPCISSRDSVSVSPETGGRYLGYGFGGGLHGDASGGDYGCGLHLMSVLADGSVAKCAFYADEAVGHVREGLRACWGRIAPISLDNLDCRDCFERASCRGGCRRRAAISGSYRGKDPYMCAFYGKINDL